MHLFTADNFPSSFLHFAKLSSEIPETGLATHLSCANILSWYKGGTRFLSVGTIRPITLYSLKFPRAFMVDEDYLFRRIHDRPM